MPTTPVMSRVQRKKDIHPEIPSEQDLEQTKINVQKATLDFVNAAEEYEREWRSIPIKIEEWLHSKEDKMNRAFARVLEEQERENRLLELLEYAKEAHVTKSTISTEEQSILDEEKEAREMSRALTTIKEEEERVRRIAEDSWYQEVAAEQRLDDAAWTTIAEEEERARRIAEDSWQDDQEEEYRKDNKAWTTIKEEEERVRRIAEENWEEEQQEEYRADDKAWSRIAEEQERDRRIAEDSYQDELLAERSQLNKADSVIKEEEERQRRISFPPTVEDIHWLKEMAIAAADAASKKNWVKRQTGGLRKSRNNNLKRSSEHKVWLPKQKDIEESKGGSTKLEETKKEEKIVSNLKPTAKPFIPKQAVLEPTGEIKLKDIAKKSEASKKDTGIAKPTEEAKPTEAKPAKERKISKSAERKKAKKLAKQQQQQLQQPIVAAAAAEVAIPTAIQMTPTEPTVLLTKLQETKPLEDRKEVVERMSRELFDRIASKVLRSDTRR